MMIDSTTGLNIATGPLDSDSLSISTNLANANVNSKANRLGINKTKFEGIWIPLITPFRNGRVDIPALQMLVADIIKAGVHGLVVCGTTGEAAHLSEAEQVAVLLAVIEVAGPAYPVVMGINGNDTLTVVNKVRRFSHFAIAGFLISAPAYVKPSQQGIFLHFQAITVVTEHPIIIYNIPARTGVNIELATLSELGADPHFVAIKESSGNLHQLTDAINQTTLGVLSGDDSLLLHTLYAGGIGAISASAHIRPDLYVYLYDLVRAGQVVQARSVFNMLLPLIRLLFVEPNPAPVKAVLALQGHISEELRLPMTPVSDTHREKLAAALDQLSNIKIRGYINC